VVEKADETAAKYNHERPALLVPGVLIFRKDWIMAKGNAAQKNDKKNKKAKKGTKAAAKTGKKKGS